MTKWIERIDAKVFALTMLLTLALAAGLPESRADTEVKGGVTTRTEVDLAGNRQTAALVKSTAAQSAKGAANVQETKAVNSSVTQKAEGFGNRQKANAVNSSVTQTARGALNEQSVNLENAQNIQMHVDGVGNKQTLILPKGAKASNISVHQSGLLNNMTMNVGNSSSRDKDASQTKR
jgi:hypothetical protein